MSKSTHRCDNCAGELGRYSRYTSHMTSVGIILICRECVSEEKKRQLAEPKKVNKDK